MPLPRWLARINKWVFNPMEVRRSHPRCHRQPAPSARVIVGGMTLALRCHAGFATLAHRAVKHESGPPGRTRATTGQGMGAKVDP